MKKFLITVSCFVLLAGSGFAYTPTTKDKVLLETLETKVAKLAETNPTKLGTIHTKLSLIINKFKPTSMEYYILSSLHQIIAIELGLKEDEETILKIIDVIDGDTIKLTDGEEEFTVRLLGIDAPELSDTMGKESRQHLGSLVEGEDIEINNDSIIGDTEDDYGRKVVYVFVGNKNINKQMIADGYAVELTYGSNYQFQTQFKKAQQDAEVQGLGMRANIQECGYKRYCTQMDSCDEAMFYLNECNVYSLDADGDGTPCENICG